jgi:cytochrome c biogenesis protein CcmG, thiol:disulfide interchange protein DsbE
VLALLLVTRVVIGDAFPKGELPTLDGEVVELPPAGRVVVVELFATWCGPCRESLPLLERVRARFGDRVTFVTVSEDVDPRAAAKVARFAAELALPGPILLDRDHALYDQLVVRKLPTTYVIDHAGVVRHINNGFGPGYARRITGWIEQELRAAPSPRGGP